MGFTDSGWSIRDGVVTPPPGMPIELAYRFVLEAIYDGHLPVTKVIGFYVRHNSVSKSAKAMVERNKACLDDQMTIATNLSKLLVLNFGLNIRKLSTTAAVGEMRVSNVDFQYSKEKIAVLSTADYLLTSHSETAIDMIINKSCGYKDASYNHKIILDNSALVRAGASIRSSAAKTRYLPLFSYHNIIDFVNVIPPQPGQSTLRLMYYFGMNDIFLTCMFEDLWQTPDIKWKSRYSEVFKC